MGKFFVISYTCIVLGIRNHSFAADGAYAAKQY
jgi:hypothetical protein